MPIRPENKLRYPKEWKEIAAAMRARAGNCCEGSPMYPDCRAAQYSSHPVTGARVVLTVAHLDHTPEHCEPANLRVMCQRCHLTYDSRHHAQTAYRTRKARACTPDLFS